MRTLVQLFWWFFRVFYSSWRCQSWFRLSVSSFKQLCAAFFLLMCTREANLLQFDLSTFALKLWSSISEFNRSCELTTQYFWFLRWICGHDFCFWGRWWFCASSSSSFSACRVRSCYIAGLISRHDDQLNFWDFHLSSLLVRLLVLTVRALPIHLVSLSSLGGCQTHPVRLTSFFCSWSWIWFKSMLFPEKCLETSHPSTTQNICLWWFVIKANVLLSKSTKSSLLILLKNDGYTS